MRYARPRRAAGRVPRRLRRRGAAELQRDPVALIMCGR
jgi:hypothetical protein